ncbi:MAG TPA: ATP-binding protein [Acidimicrobiales bacterium]|nr:ATP-binding protein [Acidimicrobiales bacterium]
MQDHAVQRGEERLHLPAHPSAPTSARSFVAGVMTRWGMDELAETATLLVSELVTNAIQHASSEVDIVVAGAGSAVRVAVHDHSGRVPLRLMTDADGRGGRGLQLVESLSDAWGVDCSPGDGKDVWFEMTLQEPA